MKIREIVLPLHHALAGTSHNPAIGYLTMENMAIVDSVSHPLSARTEMQKRIKEMKIVVSRCLANLNDMVAAIDLKNRFSEALMFALLLKSGCPVRPVPTSSEPSPDFEITFCGQPLFIEMKALNMVDPLRTLTTVMNDALDSQVRIEAQLRSGKHVASSLFEINPYLRVDRSHHRNRDSTTDLVEILIEKVDQNIDEAQFSHGQTILLIDFARQLTIHGSPRENLEREFIGPMSGQLQSGELWHLAFGEIGMPMKQVLDFDGPDNADRPLARQGLLRRHPFISGILFHGLFFKNGTFFGAAIRRRSNLRTIEFLEKISEFVQIEPGDIVQ